MIMIRSLFASCLSLLVCACATTPRAPLPGDLGSSDKECKTLDAPGLTVAQARECANALRSAYFAAERELIAGKRNIDLAVIGAATAGVVAATFGAHPDLIKGLGLTGGGVAAFDGYLAPTTRAAANRIGIDGMTCILTASADLERTAVAYQASRRSMSKRLNDMKASSAALVERVTAGPAEIDSLAAHYAIGPNELMTAAGSNPASRIREAIYRVYAKVVAAYKFGPADGPTVKAALEKALGAGKKVEKEQQAVALALRSDAQSNEGARIVLPERLLQVELLAQQAADVALASIELDTCGAQ